MATGKDAIGIEAAVDNLDFELRDSATRSSSARDSPRNSTQDGTRDDDTQGDSDEEEATPLEAILQWTPQAATPRQSRNPSADSRARKRQKKGTIADNIGELTKKMAMGRQLRNSEATSRDIEAKAKQQEAFTHAAELTFRQQRETVTERAIARLQKEYSNHNINYIIAAIELFENKQKASIFLELQGETRDAWLDKAINF